jgi:hypothetical protein
VKSISKPATKSIILLVFLLFAFTNSSAQDISYSKNDTLRFYKKLKKSAYKRKFTKFMFQVIFVDPAPLKYDKKPLSDKQKAKDPNLKYKGSVIRKIEIIVLDPFGYSANDTSRQIINPLQNFANRTHIVTQDRIIRNRLLFKKMQKVELLKISESERLLREAAFITDARILLFNPEGKTDSVDVRIIVHDKWTLDPTVSLNPNGGFLRLRDKNLMGLGQTFEQRYRYTLTSGYSVDGKYNFSNIRNTYISSSIFYSNSIDVTQLGFDINRPFYSPLAKYAGGIASSKTWGTFYKYDSILGFENKFRLDYINSDVWIAKSYSPKTVKRSNRSNTNIFAALRYAGSAFQSRPSYLVDTAKTNFNQSLYLSSVGFSLRKYYKDQYIYRFGANEDVPEGLLIQALYGISKKEGHGSRYYSGLELSQGKHYPKLGYLSGNIAFGAFYKSGYTNNATWSAGFYYFSDLSLERKWYIRQFASGRFVQGINKSRFETITLRTDEMYGFNSNSLTGIGKLILNLETVMYAPYNLIGFRFAPVIFLGFGMLQTPNIKLLASPVYQSYALGILVRNENLLNSSFEITFGMYPNQPGQSSFDYRLNPITTFKLKVRNFAISKPVIVGYD